MQKPRTLDSVLFFSKFTTFIVQKLISIQIKYSQYHLNKQLMNEDKIQALRKWLIQKGCKVHPNINIPSRIDGVLGISTNAFIPHKTLFLAIPSNLILTTTKCYNDPKLRKLFQKNDDLFDYEASQDAEFNVLCVFMMYHRIFSENSEWKEYFQAMSQPQTAVDWSVPQLAGLNRSLIEQATHVNIECKKLEEELINYLKTRKQFAGVPQQTLREIFNFCYKSVMTRSFGYYFSQTCLIPVADLVNHGCEAIDHQLMNVNFQSERQFQEGYFPRRQKIDCTLLDLKQPQKQYLPFRQRFLVQNNIVENDALILSQLDRKKINEHLLKWNKTRFEQGQDLENLHFCSEDEQEDNDTDEQFEVQKERQLDNCRRNEEEQMELFTKHVVTVQRYEDVEKKLEEMEKKPQAKQSTKSQTKTEDQPNKTLTVTQQKKDDQEIQKQQATISQQDKSSLKQQTEAVAKQCQSTNSNQPSIKTQQKNAQIKDQQTIPHTQNKDYTPTTNKLNPFTNTGGRGVPIQLIPSDSEQQEDSQEDQWGLKDGSYFTMSTSSPIGPKKQVFNSYGSRTNKFLLIWYGFCYPDNLHDSVTLRLHVQFSQNLRPASEVILDTYVGGQGLSFRKNENEIVKSTQVSRQFRFKRSNINEKLLIFLRLYLMNYYKGQDLYKLFVTFPASVEFQLFVFNYYRDIIISLYDRYPEDIIRQLKEDLQKIEYQNISHKIRYKIIYLTQQRKLLDVNLEAANAIIRILQKCKQNNDFLTKQMYQSQPIQVLRMIRKYLIELKRQSVYILYKQTQPVQQQKEVLYPKQNSSKDKQTEQQQQWEDEAEQAES